MPVGRAPRGWIVCTLVLLGALPAAASQGGPPRLETGREWLARCGAPAETADGGQTPCLAWVEGLIDINEIYRGLGALEKTSEGFCTPPDATVADAARAIARYIADRPEAQQFSARMLAYMGLRAAFPCRPPGI